MISLTAEFPLGVYHAQSAHTQNAPEWPPSPLRLIGALLAAAHRRPGREIDADRALIEKLCAADPPVIAAPCAAPVWEQDESTVAMLNSASRWAPVNYITDKGRSNAAIAKGGTAVGEQPVVFRWSNIEVDAAERKRLAVLASEVTFLGTSRSPVLLRVGEPDSPGLPEWVPSPNGSVPVRVPDEGAVTGFDQRQAGRYSSKDRVESTGLIPGIWIGEDIFYADPAERTDNVWNPEWWGDLIVLGIDSEASETIPKTAASLLVGRAMRRALLGAFEDRSGAGDAPSALHGRDDAPHCAYLSLSAVWTRHSRGLAQGVAIVLPSEARLPDVDSQRMVIEDALSSFLRGEDRRYLQIPRAGRVYLRDLDRRSAGQLTMRKVTYTRPSRSWLTVTPVVFSRWRKRGQSLRDQVASECEYVGLPKPIAVEALRGAAFPGAADRPVPAARVPEQWRHAVSGPSQHLRIEWEQPVAGPIVLGRARHFGLGMFVPEENLKLAGKNR